ncbi:hypothetical protein [Rhizobium ruizarguesonis]|uniref:hypothetical protein n=1 Tax=Rhizobium ruizarguesonis TaxID=2081791 RepID=UPI0010302090|nr:hypothetical protein [Rhizobium ruizarguesonis]TBC68724.1 hypothetical protein ELH30_31570 [Rhizobium ruizarguesonis]
MPAEVLKPALRAALRMHEIGNDTPYRLYFASKGKSGGSFGFMQGDMAAGQHVVTETFKSILRDEGIGIQKINSSLAKLSVHTIGNPLSPADTKLVNTALNNHRAEVDAMDEAILSEIYKGLDVCISVAQAKGRTISGKALLYAALWINMSGPPSKLLKWLVGKDPNLAHPVPKAPAVVTGDDIRAYLMATSYYVANPGNAPHLDASVKAGELLLP